MERKKLFTFIGVAILILLIILFLIQGCEPRNKLLETEEEIYTAFINANIDFTCKVIKDPSLLENEDSKKILNESFAKFYLPVDNDASMVDLLQRYENDPEVISIIKINTLACSDGGDAIPYLPAAQN